MKNIRQKLFRFEVDQSIRIEEMNRDSYVALANSEFSFTLKIPRRVKRRVREVFRRQGKPKMFAPYTFAVVIILAINKSGYKFQELVIDIEYPGYEKEIIKIITILFPDIEIYFTEIGKKSLAHFAAYGAYLEKRSVNSVVTAEELLSIIQK